MPTTDDTSRHDVICNYCRSTYELGRVTTTARYADCTMFITPCCGREVDDRSWKSFPPRPLPRSLRDADVIEAVITVTVDDGLLANLSTDESQALGLALHDVHFVEHVHIDWWRPVDRLVRQIKLTGDQAIIQPVVTMLVELSKTYESPVSVVRSLAAC